MTLNANSWFIRHTYWFNSGRRHWRDDLKTWSNIPQTTSLCLLFWRGVVLMPLISLAMLTVVVSGLYQAVLHAEFLANHAFFITMAFSAAAWVICVVCMFYGELVKWAQSDPEPPEWLAKSLETVGTGVEVGVGYFKARKEKFCPTIRLEVRQ